MTKLVAWAVAQVLLNSGFTQAEVKLTCKNVPIVVTQDGATKRIQVEACEVRVGKCVVFYDSHGTNLIDYKCEETPGAGKLPAGETVL